jgi:hypothetical protein
LKAQHVSSGIPLIIRSSNCIYSLWCTYECGDRRCQVWVPTQIWLRAITTCLYKRLHLVGYFHWIAVRIVLNYISASKLIFLYEFFQLLSLTAFFQPITLRILKRCAWIDKKVNNYIPFFNRKDEFLLFISKRGNVRKNAAVFCHWDLLRSTVKEMKYIPFKFKFLS